ncbi:MULTISPECIES: FecR family protein [unclassified Bradyrhizobium]|uniref:FecR family protein n=1 Tax=unclassified Bradyrhizobium TaxID=2631580 RepID=UPI002FF1A518
MSRQLSFALVLLACGTLIGAGQVFAGASELTQLAQAQIDPSQPAAPATSTPDATTPTTDAQAPEEPIGNVATVTGSASVIRDDKTTPLKVKDDIYLNDVVQTGANAALGITFIDNTTFNLKANTKITIDNYVYEDGGKSNAAIFDVAKGTAAFVAASVAKTGDMKITTPTATLGIRGTTGLVEVPEGAAANNPRNVAVKLYPDADGKVGRIEVNDRAGARLGFLTQGASGFTIRPGAGGARFAAVPLVIPQAVMLRDQGFVRQLHSTQNFGRQVVFQQREFRRANPTFVNPNRPMRQLQPGQRRQNGLPGQPGQPPLPAVPNRQGQQPDRLNRPGQPQQPGQLNRPGQQQQQPGAPNRQGQQQPRSPNQPGVPPPRTGQPSRPGLPPQPGLPPRAGPPQQPYAPAQPGAAPQGRPGLQPGVQGAPALQRPGLPAAPRRPAPAPQRGKPPKQLR